MGRGHGGTRSGSGTVATTERGLSQKVARAVTQMEESIRTNSFESVHAFDDMGNETYQKQGSAKDAYRVTGIDVKMLKDKVVTHNHPRSLGKSGIKSIGNSLSPSDIVTAVVSDAREMRAASPRYTFSMKRPAGGWGVSEKELKSRYSSVVRRINKLDSAYIKSQNYKVAAIERAEATYWHRVNKALAKSLGWDYSKSKKK